jgi:hypothetical protein
MLKSSLCAISTTPERINAAVGNRDTAVVADALIRAGGKQSKKCVTRAGLLKKRGNFDIHCDALNVHRVRLVSARSSSSLSKRVVIIVF